MPVPADEDRTEGPDRNNPCLNCRDFHDPFPVRAGSLQHLCCCNTCTTIRPGVVRDGIDHLHCCRCLPRYLMLLFVPYGGDCCRSGSTPLVFQSTAIEEEEPDWPVSTYTGSLFGYTVTAELGRLFDEYVEYGDCVWRFIVEKGSFLEELVLSVDDVSVSCLDVDGIVLAEGLEGPDGCVGTLMLANAEIGRIPFVLRDDVASAEMSGPAYPAEFIDLDPPCGYCETVCRVLCVFRLPSATGEGGFQEFTWFENVDAGTRGWGYTRPGTEITDYIYLEENESGECILSFDIDGVGGPPDQVIDIVQGCACGMKEIVTGSVPGGSVRYTIRCGFCSCWKFYCGTCRCVPRYLCVQSYIDNTFTPNQILTWDEDELGWLPAYGENDLALYLQPDDDDGCEIVVSIDGYETALNLSVVRNCGTEHVSRNITVNGQELDRSNDFLTFEIQDTSEYELVWLLASAPTYTCDVGPCGDATPCRDECGSHPATLTALLHAYNDSYDGDEPGWDDVVCDLEIILYYWEQIDWTGAALEITCGYVGWAFIGFCDSGFNPGTNKWIKIELTNGILVAHEYYDDGTNQTEVYQTTLTESCDPYYGDSGVEQVGLITCPWSCSDTVQRIQTTVVE